MRRKQRYKVVAVQMYDVIDTFNGDEIVFNTRDQEDATRVADEHEHVYYNPPQEEEA